MSCINNELEKKTLRAPKFEGVQVKQEITIVRISHEEALRGPETLKGSQTRIQGVQSWPPRLFGRQKAGGTHNRNAVPDIDSVSRKLVCRSGVNTRIRAQNHPKIWNHLSFVLWIFFEENKNISIFVFF